jgi:hypothetical protein
MEFEFERDTLNPLYPPIPLPDFNGIESASSANTSSSGHGGGSTDESDQTVKSVSSVNIPSAVEPTSGRLVDPTPPQVATETMPSSALQSLVEEKTIAVRNQPDSLATTEGTDGLDHWRPSAEDIMESTTSRSKPLPALERLRRMSRAYGGPATSSGSGTSSPPMGRQRRSRGMNSAAGRGVGMMDVFAVMAQINEQLGAAPDLDTFLNVLVGVIKDLTQFHRVLVYQFDEMWNGKVVAELVDWSATHDLFRGLHFPAGDIPAQVGLGVFLVLVFCLTAFCVILRPANSIQSVRRPDAMKLFSFLT